VSRSLTLRPRAKINLSLRVGARRPDGFHEVRTLLQSIALSDRLVVTARRGPFTLRVRGAGVPADRTNLVWRAADALWRSLGRSGDARDVHVTLDKHIPVGAGLGGGSADAAAALVGLNRLWAGRRTARDLAQLAAGLGSDVPFFLQGGTALGVGRGDDLFPVDDIRRLGVVILKPPFAVATADAYRWLDEDAAASDPVATPDESMGVDVGWPTGGVALVNDLAGPVSRRHPEIDAMLTALRGAKAIAAAMTGSGSAVFGLFPAAGATRVARRLGRSDWLVLVTRTVTRREAGLSRRSL
jgi:4-diphosphocytidyl-2-C-methyl-D-erythritol kinase